MVVHIWEYQRYQGYHQSLHQISTHPEFPEFDKKIQTLLQSKHISLMQEFSFWPTTPPRQLGGLFELRSYTLHPGNLLEWETHWRKELGCGRLGRDGAQDCAAHSVYEEQSTRAHALESCGLGFLRCTYLLGC
jgi:hypothetical protein